MPARSRRTSAHAIADAGRRAVPDGAVVVASPNVVAHLANRSEAYVFPIDSHYAEELGWRKKRPDCYVLDLIDDLTNRATVFGPAESAQRRQAVQRLVERAQGDGAERGRPRRRIRSTQRWADRLLLKGYDVERTPDGTRVIL